jgi:hypothetical protein
MSGFHVSEIEECRELICKFIREDPELFDENSMEFFEDILDSYIHNRMDYEEETGSTKAIFSTAKSVMDESDSEPETVPLEDVRTNMLTNPEEPECENEDDIPSFSSVLSGVIETLRNIHGIEATIDMKTAKDSYNLYKLEISTFEGRMEENVPRGLIPKIERYVCHHYKLPPKEEIRKRPHTEKGDRENTSRKMIYDALADLSLGKYSHLVSKISHKLWGSQLPNMKEHYLDILHDCVLQKEIFNRMSASYGRKSNISQRVILMYISQRHGYKWDVDDFRISFSPVTLKKHLDILHEIFSIIDRKKTI